MTGKQLQIYLPPEATGRLNEMARQECRRPIDQARYLLLRALLGNPQQVTNNNTGAKVSEAKHAGVVEVAR